MDQKNAHSQLDETKVVSGSLLNQVLIVSRHLMPEITAGYCSDDGEDY